MRKFTSIEDVSINDMVQLLDDWEDNKLTRGDILYLAEELQVLCPEGRPSYPKDDSRSILFGVLSALVTLHIQPILKEDIPVIKKFLLDGQAEPINAWKMIDNYWDSIDWEQRLRDMYGHNRIV